MVSSISSSSGDSSYIQQLMEEMRKKMSAADTDGTSGLSLDELSSIDAGDDVGGANFLSCLQKNFDSIDTDGDGQLTQSEIDASRPEPPPMGPPPGMNIESYDSSSSSDSSSLSDLTSSLFDFVAKQYSNNESSFSNSLLSGLLA